MKKEAVLYEQLENKKVKCNICARRCLISEGKRGNCSTRINEDGILYTLVYGSLISQGSIDPIEKKPLYNFWPGYNIYSIATIGCNFHCTMCQNWSISQCHPNEDGSMAICKDVGNRGSSYPLVKMKPEQLIKKVLKSNCKMIAYTYNEPTIWHEYIIDVGRLAKEEGILNVLVTNGFSTPEASNELVKVIDAANIDIKAFSDDFYKRIVTVPSLQPVLNTAIHWKSKGIHIEITNLIIPDENDDEKGIRDMSKWIQKKLGNDTPIHFSAYHPDYKMNEHKRTPASTLEKAYNIAKEEGLSYVYIGNLLTSKGNDTFCPKCNENLIQRSGYSLKKINLGLKNQCPNCGFITGIKGSA
ncbi:MAG: AmmeMemoRadiSam system radical SAM enzyme, partial [archaeon]|nr:AmmeMemoRadiSam system radical SAM enzyme [archaeon]